MKFKCFEENYKLQQIFHILCYFRQILYVYLYGRGALVCNGGLEDSEWQVNCRKTFLNDNIIVL